MLTSHRDPPLQSPVALVVSVVCNMEVIAVTSKWVEYQPLEEEAAVVQVVYLSLVAAQSSAAAIVTYLAVEVAV